jgi:hypothetical protein
MRQGAARCVDASAPKHAAEARRGEWIELTSDQWHFLRAALRRQALIKIDGCSGGMVVFIDGDKACTPLAVPDELLAMMDDVATATISHEGTAL